MNKHTTLTFAPRGGSQDKFCELFLSILPYHLITIKECFLFIGSHISLALYIIVQLLEKIRVWGNFCNYWVYRWFWMKIIPLVFRLPVHFSFLLSRVNTMTNHVIPELDFELLNPASAESAGGRALSVLRRIDKSLRYSCRYSFYVVGKKMQDIAVYRRYYPPKCSAKILKISTIQRFNKSFTDFE